MTDVDTQDFVSRFAAAWAARDPEAFWRVASRRDPAFAALRSAGCRQGAVHQPRGGRDVRRGSRRPQCARCPAYRLCRRDGDDLRDAYFALQSADVPILLEIVWERPDALEIFARGRGDEDRPLVFSR